MSLYNVFCFFIFAEYPSTENQKQFLKQFYREILFDGDVSCLEYIEAHAIGHPETDRDEADALSTLTLDDTDFPIYIGSVKPVTGHLMAASSKIVCF